MLYQIVPMGNIWAGGMFSVPTVIASYYIKMASEYQLKALLLVLANNGVVHSKDIAHQLGTTKKDIEDILDFWVSEGVLVKEDTPLITATPDYAVGKPPMVVSVVEHNDNESKPANATSQPKLESLPLPTLSPSDIVKMCSQNQDLTELMQASQEVLGTTLSHAQEEALVNMVTYYGLPVEVVLMILQYYKNQKQKGRALGIAYLNAMAKDWAEQGITTLSCAEEKLGELELSDKMWAEIVALTGIRHRNPTQKQRQTVSSWFDDFSMEMIALACDVMKEHAERPSLSYVDKVLKNWKKKSIFTPADVLADNDKFAKSKADKDKIQSAPTYDIDEITRQALLNTEYDI